MDQQALIAALMGGQNNVQPSAISQMPDQQQFSPQMLGYGQQIPGQMPQMQPPGQPGGMFSPPPYGAQSFQNATPQNNMGY